MLYIFWAVIIATAVVLLIFTFPRASSGGAESANERVGQS
jgi:hypothetical protein